MLHILLQISSYLYGSASARNISVTVVLIYIDLCSWIRYFIVMRLDASALMLYSSYIWSKYSKVVMHELKVSYILAHSCRFAWLYNQNIPMQFVCVTFAWKSCPWHNEGVYWKLFLCTFHNSVFTKWYLKTFFRTDFTFHSATSELWKRWWTYFSRFTVFKVNCENANLIINHISLQHLSHFVLRHAILLQTWILKT